MDYNSNYSAGAGYELGWDSEIANDSPDFVTVPEGDYRFTVIGMDRERHPGSAKLPPCNKAVVHIRIEQTLGECVIKHNLFLHSKCEGLLCEFFRGIGQRQHGQRIAMDWSRVIGATGMCHVTRRKYTNRDGQERETNDITKFYDPAPGTAPAMQPQAQPAPQPMQQPVQQQMQWQPAAQAGGYVPGKF